MRFLHTMIRVKDLDAALTFFCQDLGLIEIRRQEFPEGKFTLVFLSTHEGAPEIELTYNWDQSEPYSIGRFFGHMAFEVENIYETCQRLMDRGITINRPPRDGYMAFIKSPDQVSIELLQKGPALAKQEPRLSMPNTGTW